MVRRHFDDLDGDFCRDFAWKPAIGLEDGLRAMAQTYAEQARLAGPAV